MWFPLDYEDARSRWRHAVRGLGGEQGQWQVSPGLETDHGYWPAQDQQTLYVIVSGVHGPETFAGHAIQIMFLKEIFPRLDRRKAGVLMVHALNPYGFKHNRRCTESGVNLNRNCSLYPELYRTQNPDSLRISERFIPRLPLASELAPILTTLQRHGERVAFDELNMNDFIRACCAGQYAQPEGLEFGGFGPEPQIAQWIARLREVMPGYKNVVLVDLHTGLGHRGRLHLLKGDKPGCINSELFNEIFDANADRDAYEYTPNDQEGFYPTFGSTNDLLAELCELGRQRLCALTFEFGTLGHEVEHQIESLNVWLASHQGLWHGFATPELERRVNARHLEKFYPSDPIWRQAVIEAARKTLTRIFQRSGHL